MEQIGQIERKDTGIRILLTLVFFVIIRIVEVVLAAIILFQLAFTLITKRPAGESVVRFANRVITYVVQMLRYLTYQEDQRPFPFSDFPAETESRDTAVSRTAQLQG